MGKSRVSSLSFSLFSPQSRPSLPSLFPTDPVLSGWPARGRTVFVSRSERVPAFTSAFQIFDEQHSHNMSVVHHLPTLVELPFNINTYNNITWSVALQHSPSSTLLESTLRLSFDNQLNLTQRKKWDRNAHHFSLFPHKQQTFTRLLFRAKLTIPSHPPHTQIKQKQKDEL